MQALKNESIEAAAEAFSATDEYNKYLEELRQSVIEYGKKTNQQEIVEKAANLFKTANLHAEINSLIEFLKQLELVKN